jgi:hypothetical protein
LLCVRHLHRTSIVGPRLAHQLNLQLFTILPELNWMLHHVHTSLTAGLPVWSTLTICRYLEHTHECYLSNQMTCMYWTHTPQVLGRCGFQWWDNFSPPSATCFPRYQDLDDDFGDCANTTPSNHLELHILTLKSLFQEWRRLLSVLRRQVDRSQSPKEFSKLPYKLSRCQGQKHFVSEIEGYKIPRRKPCARDLRPIV